MPANHSPPAELFFCYSHRDRALRDQLERHLAILARTGVIANWHDGSIDAGQPWAAEIASHLDRAAIILLLVSSDFLSSYYCYDVELRRAMERHAAGTTRVIPVILRAVEWQDAPFASLQALPTDGRPVTSWDNTDEAFADVARAIRRVALRLPSPGAMPTLGGHRRSYYPVAQRQLIDESSRGFVGRAELQRAFARFVSRHGRGYFLVQGAPGEGKTALAARIVRTHKAIHHFAARSSGRAEPRPIVLSLLEQLGAARQNDVRTATVEELVLTLEDTLTVRASADRPVVIVLDAINEMSGMSGDDIPLLPAEELPTHVYCFVTSQPGERLDRLMEQLIDVPHELHTLGPLSGAEAEEMIRQRIGEGHESIAAAIATAAAGSPLYIRAALSEYEQGREFDVRELPGAVEGYFRRAMRKVHDESLLHDVLGVLAAARKPLSIVELSQVTGVPQRRTHTEGILPVRQFLFDDNDQYTFYHQRFHDFVAYEVLYQDELARYHRAIADWLEARAREHAEYYWSSFAWHLYSAGQQDRLAAAIDPPFLVKKLRRSGYDVLDDLELVARGLLEVADPSVVQRCVDLVEQLRGAVGTAGVDEVARRVQPNRGRGTLRGEKPVEPTLASIPGLDIHAVLLPKGAVTADFIQIVPLPGRVVAAIGDAPSTGLKSAFVARFIASAFRRLVETAGPLHLGHVLGELNGLISAHAFFERVSLQCIEVVPGDGWMAIANAAHPYPIVYSARRGRCDVLPVHGPRLHELEVAGATSREYEQRHAELEPGDIVVMASDGLTEGGRLDSNAYGYSYAALVQKHAGSSARAICHAVLEGWRAHPRDPQWLDDTAILVIKMTGTGPGHAD